MGKTKKNKQNSTKLLSDITTGFKEIADDPTQFLLVVPEKKQKDIKSLLQQTYKACIQLDKESKKTVDILPELVVEDMDEEQIWQQLELRNNALLTGLIDNTSKLLALREEKLEVRLDEDDENENVEDLEENNLEANEEDKNMLNESEDDDDEEPEFLKRDKEFKKKRTGRSSIVDDKFFKLSEMEAFLEEEDAKEMRKKGKPDDSMDAGIDYFAEDLGVEDEDDEEDEDEANPTYKEFFDEEEEDTEDEPKKAKNKQKDYFEENVSDEEDVTEKEENNADEDDDEDDDDGSDLIKKDDAENYDSENEGVSAKDVLQPASSGSDDDSEGEDEQGEEKPQSSFQVRQARLEQRMREYEDIVLGEKPWQLRGEVQATNRPHNSLLEEVLEFESTMAPPPVITETTTRRLEDIIKQRIRDQAWDDPVYVMKPVQTANDLRKQLILDHEKSKESLAQVYEKEYQKELDKFDPARADAAEEEPKEHKEIKRLMRALFVKLDALSNFHFTPKPVAPEARIITNTPAVTMEEVAPVAVSDAKLLAPEEVYRGPKNGLLGKTERTRTDKNRERRKKKQKQRVIHRLLDEKSKIKQEQGIAPTKKEESAKLLKSLTKHRNVEKLNTTSDDQRALKSSKSFFSKLQDTTSSAGKAASAAKAKKHKSTGKNITAKRVKL
ncbi:U3 small nucleolar ribonucleoprotein protein MPP10 [Eurosta solidaginis]|uniref:U3 small nucleolar ribonucleoprotein protein MPP10 n=1 Tax=Eurosta solidaginis TaxID=178769 RepID=UPI003530B554